MHLTDALVRLLDVKQMEQENLTDYTKRFKQLRDVVKSQLGTKLLDKFMENQEDYRTATDTTAKDAIKEAAFEKWTAYLYLRGSDQAKYGTLMKGFVSQFSLGNDQYPKTLTSATDVLSNHKLDAKYHDNQRKHRDRNRNERNDQNDRTECEPEPSNTACFAQRNIAC